jgi:Fe-S-cluster containining protein
MKIKSLKKNNISKCFRCDQLCCKYITVKIDAPRSIRDFDGLLWQLSHKNINIFKDSTGWYLLIHNPCIHLNGNGECSIYNDRPITCREHSSEHCENDNSIVDTALLFFDSYQSLDNYCKKKFKTWNKRFA